MLVCDGGECHEIDFNVPEPAPGYPYCLTSLNPHAEYMQSRFCWTASNGTHRALLRTQQVAEYDHGYPTWIERDNYQRAASEESV